MKNVGTVGIIVFLIGILVNCEGDYRPEATGSFGEAVVIMDSTRLDSETATAIQEVFAQGIFTLPGYEPLMDLRFEDFKNNNELEDRRKHKNLIIAGVLDDSTNTGEWIRALLSDGVEEEVRAGNNFAFPLGDEWYKNQWAIILTSTSDSLLAQKILQSKETLANQLLQKELSRWTEEVYERGEQTALSDSLMQNHGWKIRVQHDWEKNIDTTYTQGGQPNHFVTMRRPLSNNDRWFWAWWVDDAPPVDSLSPNWINAKRDSLMKKWIRGSRADSYVATEYRRAVETDTLSVDGHPAYETLGTWRMTNDAMGGPFANMTVYDEARNRLFMLEFGQFAPKFDKRRFVRQFRAILRTFESDSSWSGASKQMVIGS